MVGIKRIISVVSLVAVVASCAPRYDFFGKWEGKRKVEIVPGGDGDVGRTLARIDLTIDSRDDYVLVDGGIPSSGHLVRTKTGATLEPKSILDRGMYRQSAETKAMFGGTTLTIEGDGLRFRSNRGADALLTRRSPSG